MKGVPQVRTTNVEVADSSSSPKKSSQLEISDSPSHRSTYPLVPPPYRDPPPPTSAIKYDKFKKNIIQVIHKVSLNSLKSM